MVTGCFKSDGDDSNTFNNKGENDDPGDGWCQQW